MARRQKSSTTNKMVYDTFCYSVDYKALLVMHKKKSHLNLMWLVFRVTPHFNCGLLHHYL